MTARLPVMKRFLLFVLALGWANGPVLAELVFDKEHLVLKPTVDQEVISATYTFTYKGEKPIVVTEVDANCGCINAKSDKERYEKGDEGKLTFDFELGHREGKQEARVWMGYHEEKPKVKSRGIALPPGPSGEDPSTFQAPLLKQLTAEIQIPIVVNIEPKKTTWVVDSKPEPKAVKVTMKHLNPVKLLEVKSSRDDVKIETKAVKEGESYIITITPGSTKKKQMGMLTLVTDCALERHQKKLAFYSIAAETPADDTPSLVPPPAAALEKGN